MTIDLKAKRCFRNSETEEGALWPPDQVFVNPNFVFLLTIGGNLVSGDEEYQRLMKLLKELGETEFYILENIAATSTERTTPFQATISVDSDDDYFQKVGKSFDPQFGFLPYSFFVFGNSDNWGIYLCEHPTINIIGCTAEIVEKFSKVYDVVENGFIELVDFIAQEYQYKMEPFEKLVNNYHLFKGGD